MSRSRATRSGDSGFTLVEVVVALALIAIVASAGLYFFVNGTRSVTETQRAQNAVVVANEAMELAYSVAAEADKITNMSGLVAGRTEAAVTAAWNLATTHAVEGLDHSYPVWDPAPTTPEAVAITRHSTNSSVEYTATTLIGSCYRSLTGDDCSRLPGVAVEPATTPSGYVRLMRIMVLVTWPETKAGTCPDDLCSYELSGLADPNTDLEWNNVTQPVAVNDIAEVWIDEQVEIDILANDFIGPVYTSPVRELAMVSGAGHVHQPAGKATVTYVPNGASGHETFSYKLKDQGGRESNTATVLVKVLPKAVDDIAETSRNQPVTIDVTSNDLGSPAAVQVVAAPQRGQATVTGTTIVYHPQGHTGDFTFRYTFTDGAEQVSTEATVTVTVTAHPLPKAENLLIGIPATQSGSNAPFDLLDLTENPSDFTVRVHEANISQGRLRVDGHEWLNHKTGTNLSYDQQGNVLGIHTFKYSVSNPDGVVSEIKTATLVLIPTPKNDTFTVQRNKSHQLNVGTNDAPNNYGGTAQFAAVATSSDCSGNGSDGTVTVGNDAKNGIVRFSAPNRSTTCTFTYTISGKGAYEDMVSAPATVTVKVT